MESAQMSCESESEGDLVIVDTDYVQEAEHIILSHNEITIENALILNKQMRLHLVQLRAEVERLLKRCQTKYKQNEDIMTEMSQKKSPTLISTTYYFCGYPYFKDRSGSGAPLPAEYYQRRDKYHELFPIDLLDKRTFWLPRDKMDLVQGVKKQAVSFLQSKNRDRIRNAAERRYADDIILRLKTENESLGDMHLSELYKKSELKNFRIDWMTISYVDMDGRHSENECLAMWTNYLMPSLNRKQWTDEEEELLLAAVDEHKSQNWFKIAKHLKNRSPFQCFVHFRTAFNDRGVTRNARWTPEEDQNLISFIDKYRIGNVIPWTKIMDKMPGRSKLQLYNRYMFTLNPQINRSPFTTEEDCILMAAIKEYGENFRNFPPNLLPGRQMKQIRSRYNNVLKFVKSRDHWSEQHDTKLMNLVDKYGTSDWVTIANEMVNHNRTSCRQRYTTIRKFLDKNPNCTIAQVPRRKKAFSSNVTTDNWMETIINTKQQQLLSSADESDSNEIMDERLERNSKYFASNSIGCQWYNFLKYSFNFRIGERVPATDSVFENIQIVAQLLQAPSIPHQMDVTNNEYSNFITKVNTSKKYRLETDVLTSLSEMGKNDFLFPVNANTVLGLRGLVTMFESKSLERKKMPKPKREPITFDEHAALNLFRRRFKSLFQNTASVANLTDHVSISQISMKSEKPEKRRRKVHSKAKKMMMSKPSSTIVRAVPIDASTSTSQTIMNRMDSPVPSTSHSNRITILESITIGSGSQDNIYVPQTSMVPNYPMHTMQQYMVDQPNYSDSNSVYNINIQPFPTLSIQQDDLNHPIGLSNTNFVVCDPMISDEATGLTAPKKSKHNHI